MGRHSPGVDLVCKVGGSLSRPEVLGPLFQMLEALQTEYRVLVVPGGGSFTDGVRAEAATFQLRDTTSHWMAILAMDQYGYLLADLGKATRTVRTLAEIEKAIQDGVLPILLPSALLLATDPLPHSWDVTSDSIAAYIAITFGADLLILLKDVDGVLTADPRKDPTAELIPHLELSRLKEYACVDAAFVREAQRLSRCWIINGRHPERLTTLLRSGKAVGTEVQTMGPR